MKNKIYITLIVIIGLLVYIATLKAVPGNITSSSPLLTPPFNGEILPFELSGSRSAFATLLAINENRSFSLTNRLADFAAPDTGYYNGNLFSFFPPGVALIGLPFYRLGEHFNLSLAFSYFSISVLAVLSLVILFKISSSVFNLPKWTSFFIVILCGFASHFLNFSISFYQQIPSAFLVLVMFYYSWKYKNSTKYAWLYSSIVWLGYGISSFINYPNIVLLLPIMFYFLSSSIIIHEEVDKYSIKLKKAFLITSVLLALLICLHIFYNVQNFGYWKRFSNTLPQYNPSNSSQTLEALQSKNLQDIVKKKEAVQSIFSENGIINGLNVNLFALNKSLLMHDPFSIFALLGILIVVRYKKIKGEYKTIIGTVIVNLFIYASFHDPWGGWSYGPRYLVPSVPFLSILFGVWLAHKTNILKKIVSIIFFSYGAFVALLGALGKNIVIPVIEAKPLGLPSTYMANFNLVKEGKNGSFFFNQYLSNLLTLEQFLFVLFVSLVIFAALTLFWFPKFENKHEHLN